MPRILRTSLGDGVYHVHTLGVDHADVYRDDADRLVFLVLLAATVKRYGWNVHHYCLMGSHYHLIVETTQPQLSAGMQYLNGRHAQSFNQRYKRVGHLFGGRFKSKLIEGEDYYEQVVKYVLENPVKAGLCE